MNFLIKVQHKKIYFYIHFFIILLLFKICSNYIILPFKSINIIPDVIGNTEKNEKEKIVSILNNDIIYTSISFGTPSSTIDFYFSMEEYPSYINQNICLKESKSLYSPHNSESLKSMDYDLFIEKCSLYADLNLTKNISIDSFLFYMNKENEIEDDFIDNKYCGIIGLNRYPQNSEFNFKSFIYNLKNNNYINSYSFGFFFFTNNNNKDDFDGFLIAGASYNDNIEIFDIDIAYTVYAEEGTLYWTVNFERIFYYQKVSESIEYISTNNTKVEFIIDLNYIISDEQYYEGIKKYYFQKFFDNDTCYEEKTLINEETVYMIICNINFKQNMNTFPDIFFYNQQLFYAFNLCWDDLFYEYDDKIYFLIIRKEHIKDYWRIGKIFLKKYPFIFDYEKKIVSYVFLKKNYWNPKIKENNKIRAINNNNNKNSNFKEYSIYIFLFIGVIIGICIGKRIWNKNKKLKANELEEQYKYYGNDKLDDKKIILN